MINSFKHKGLRRLFEDDDGSGVEGKMTARLKRMLADLDVAGDLKGLRVPTYKLHQLSGDRAGVWSMRVAQNWRMTFRFKDGDAFDVDLEDYH